jgi:hypothetical protein
VSSGFERRECRTKEGIALKHRKKQKLRVKNKQKKTWKKKMPPSLAKEGGTQGWPFLFSPLFT